MALYSDIYGSILTFFLILISFQWKLKPISVQHGFEIKPYLSSHAFWQSTWWYYYNGSFNYYWLTEDPWNYLKLPVIYLIHNSMIIFDYVSSNSNSIYYTQVYIKCNGFSFVHAQSFYYEQTEYLFLYKKRFNKI